jgi:protease PrsW
MEFFFSLFPVLLFLACLFLLDSFKLVSQKFLLLSMLWGIMSAGLAFLLNTSLADSLSINFTTVTRYIAPVTEEVLKAILIFILIGFRRIGFAIDAAIYGFAIGAGFALTENIVYIVQLGPDAGLFVWILRGFGTAVMHGGCTALLAMIMMLGIQRDKPAWLSSLPGLALALVVHSGFNHFAINPFLQTALIIIVLPTVFVMVFNQSNNMLQDWLEIEFNNEVDMLRMIRQGKFKSTRAGEYLASIKNHFSPEMIVDMYWYISLYLELSIKAKRNMMLKESGFPITPEAGIREKLIELQQLRKQIGKIGEMSLRPLIRINHRELWKMNQLK